MAHAAPLLERYRDTHLVFNDDIQGTATCAVGGVYGAMAVRGTLSSHTVANVRFLEKGRNQENCRPPLQLSEMVLLARVELADKGTTSASGS